MPFQRITANLVGAKKRYETLEGKQYLVVPTVMLTEGVHNGSQGPLYYKPEEMGKNPQTWNHKPVVLYHPSMGGEGITACDPNVIERQKVGLMFNTVYADKLKTETWLDEDKLKRISSDVLDRIKEGKSVEVSTGLFHDRDKTPGTWNGESYIGSVTNIQPDHLAILPDEVGACSIAKGAGLLRNADGSELSYDDIREQLRNLLHEDRNGSKLYTSDYCYVCDVYKSYAIYDCNDKCYKIGYKVKAGKVSIVGQPEEVRKMTNYVTANGQTLINEDQQGPLHSVPQPSASQLSPVMQKQQAQRALSEKYSGITQEGDWGGWITEIFANYVIYSKDGKLFRLPYTYDDDKINFDGEPEEVERVSEYRARRQTPIDGTQSPYNVNSQGEGDMATKEQIDTIIRLADLAKAGKLTDNQLQRITTNAVAEVKDLGSSGKDDSQTRTTGREAEVNKMISSGAWDEKYRSFLQNLPDGPFEKIKGDVLKGATQPTVPYGYAGVGDRSNVHSQNGQNPNPTTTPAPQPAVQNVQTVQEYIAQAPPEMRDILQNAISSQEEEKQRLIKLIVNNPGNVFNPDWLIKNCTMPQLKGMAALARGQQTQNQPTANYGGQADVPMFLNPQSLTQNAGNQASEDEDTLQVMGMDFSKAG